jgi:hypothetical protein
MRQLIALLASLLFVAYFWPAIIFIMEKTKKNNHQKAK